jgi:hypothetical protein
LYDIAEGENLATSLLQVLNLHILYVLQLLHLYIQL